MTDEDSFDAWAASRSPVPQPKRDRMQIAIQVLFMVGSISFFVGSGLNLYTMLTR